VVHSTCSFDFQLRAFTRRRLRGNAELCRKRCNDERRYRLGRRSVSRFELAILRNNIISLELLLSSASAQFYHSCVK
jgi:hypothetical protein